MFNKSVNKPNLFKERLKKKKKKKNLSKKKKVYFFKEVSTHS